jgi:hypothetical protein
VREDVMVVFNVHRRPTPRLEWKALPRAPLRVAANGRSASQRPTWLIISRRAKRRSNPSMSPSAEVYRVRRTYVWFAAACCAFFVAIDVTTVVAAWWNIDGSFARPKLAAVLFGLFWSAWALASVWLWSFAVRYRLNFTAEEIVQQGAWFRKVIPRHALQTIVWRTIPRGGSVRVKSPYAAATIEFGLFTEAERQRVIERVRGLIDADRQEHWEVFHRRHVLHEVPPPPINPLWARRLVSAGLLAFALFFAAQGAVRGENRLFVMAAVNLAAALWTWRSGR